LVDVSQPFCDIQGMILLIDNYDSFTYNLVQRLGEIDATLDVRVVRNDQITLDEITALAPQRIIVSPGPCTPREAGISKQVIERFGPLLPVLGVCLGHQCIGEVYGWEVNRADRLMHGKVSQIHHDSRGVFAGLANPFSATRYHSLVVRPDDVHDDLEVCAWTNDPDQPREVMGVRHRRFPIHGVQFHPESFLTEAGIELLKNFLVLRCGATCSPPC
jgi:anthranilate synthase/aminodeoxychorismate synthase-like glutamine amidotransferase